MMVAGWIGAASQVISAAFSPADIAGLQLWLEADGTLWQDSARTTPAVADGVVGAWDDASGKGNHATQATTSKKPLLKLNIVNGKPVVRFDGTDDYLDAALGTLNAPLTFFVVAYFANLNQGNNDYDYIYSMGDGTVDVSHVNISRTASNDGGGADKYYLYDGVVPLLYGPTLAGQSWMIFSQVIRLSSTYHKLWLNGATQTVDDLSAAINTNGSFGLGYYRSGGSNYLTGDIGEFLIYNSALSDADRKQVETYLNGKYNVF